jgi:hypothetical protein
MMQTRRFVDARKDTEPIRHGIVFSRMYVRFVVPSLGRNAWGLSGIIQAACDLKDARAFTYFEEVLFDDIYDWFNRNLPVPRRFSRSRKSGAAHNAVCWFKPAASECVKKARRLAHLLESRCLWTLMLRTWKPGYVVYEDRFQIAAEPFYDTYQRRQ